MGGLDIYDRGGGAVLVAWPKFPGVNATSYNLYLDGVLNQNVPPAGKPLLTQLGLFLLTEQAGVLEAEGPALGLGGVAIVSGMTVASYNGVTETVPTTHTIRVVPLIGANEVGPALDAKVTPSPTNVMLVTPMPRGRFGFPSTPGGY